MEDFEDQIQSAVRHFWSTRTTQGERQGATDGRKDAGNRTEVTGGKHLDGFIQAFRKIAIECGVSDAEVFVHRKLEVPGYFRAEKQWDLLVVSKGNLLAVIEFKAFIGPSFSNNCNNRAEEAVGNAADFWAAFKYGAFEPSARPWLGFLFILEDCKKTQATVKVKEPHFKAFEEFRGASYAKRIEILLVRLLRERLYDGSALLLIDRQHAKHGIYTCPNEEASISRFIAGFSSHILAFSKNNDGRK